MFYDSSFVFHSHSVSIGRVFGHTNASPTIAAHTFYIRGSCECNFFQKTLPWQLLSPYVLPDFYVVKIFVLKYFCRTPTLRKFFNTKIYPTKISYNENFPIYGIELVVALRRFTLPLSSSRGSLQKSEVHQHCCNYGSLQAFHSESQIVYLPVQKGKTIHNPFLLV